MKSITQIVAILLMAFMIAACTTTSEERKEASKKAYPNREWQRPPSHWSPP